eukprot:89707_1
MGNINIILNPDNIETSQMNEKIVAKQKRSKTETNQVTTKTHHANITSQKSHNSYTTRPEFIKSKTKQPATDKTNEIKYNYTDNMMNIVSDNTWAKQNESIKVEMKEQKENRQIDNAKKYEKVAIMSKSTIQQKTTNRLKEKHQGYKQKMDTMQTKLNELRNTNTKKP